MLAASFLSISNYVIAQEEGAKRVSQPQAEDELVRTDNREFQKAPLPEISSPQRGMQIADPKQPYFTSFTLPDVISNEIEPVDKGVDGDASGIKSVEADWVQVMSENFESTFPSGLWTIDTLPMGEWQTTDARWARSNCKPYAGTYSAACAAGGSEGVTCGSNYPVNMFTYMAYGPFDLSDASDAYMDFYWWAISEDGWDYFIVAASIDGEDYYGVQWTGYNNSWSQYTFDLTSVNVLGDLSGEPQVWVVFLFYSDFIITEPDGAYVDNVELWKDISAGPADLALAGGTFSPNPIMEDASLAIAPQIINNGESSAIDSEIEYYLSSNTTITQSDCYLGNDSVTLAPGATGFESILVDLGTVGCVSPGTYYVGIYFVDEGNGEYFPTPLVINSTSGTPDLTLSGGTYSPNPVMEDGTLSIDPQISNVGSEAAASSEIEYYLSSNTMITTGDIYLGNDYVTLGPGETGSESITVDLNTIGGLSPGTYYVGVYFVDESNGESFPTPLIVSTSTTAPNLTLSGGTFSPNPVYENGMLSINPQITNIGLGAATNSVIEYYISTNSTITQSDCYLGNGFVTLGPSETGTESFSADLNSVVCVSPGIYYVGIYFVDEGSGEEFPTTLEISSTPVATELSLLGGNCSPNPVKENQTLSLYPIITYTGPGTITSTEMQYYLSDNISITPTDCYLGNQYVTLDSGQVSPLSFSVGLNSVGCIDPGTYYAGVYFVAEATGWHFSNPLVINDAEGTSVSYVESDMPVSIYPNPANDILFIKSLNDNNTDITVRIFNNLGDVVYLKTLENMKSGDEIKIDLSNLTEGLYFLQIQNDRIINIEKLIKN